MFLPRGRASQGGHSQTDRPSPEPRRWEGWLPWSPLVIREGAAWGWGGPFGGGRVLPRLVPSRAPGGCPGPPPGGLPSSLRRAAWAPLRGPAPTQDAGRRRRQRKRAPGVSCRDRPGGDGQGPWGRLRPEAWGADVPVLRVGDAGTAARFPGDARPLLGPSGGHGSPRGWGSGLLGLWEHRPISALAFAWLSRCVCTPISGLCKDPSRLGWATSLHCGSS